MRCPLLLVVLCVLAVAGPVRADDASLKGFSRAGLAAAGAAEAGDVARAYRAAGFPPLREDQSLRYAAVRGIVRGLTAEADLDAFLAGYQAAARALPTAE